MNISAATTSQPPIMEASQLYKTFRTAGGMFKARRILHAVTDVSLQVRRGEVLGIVGESGCGKSTLLRMLIGTLRPSNGQITIEGRSLDSLGHSAVARKVQPIFQDPYSSLNPRRTVGSIIGQPLHVHHIGETADRTRRVQDLMDRVGLPARYYSSYPSELSGGQRQRVAIARALIMSPKIIVCDEPTSALDVSVQSQILNLLMDMKRDLDLTIIIVSHNLAVIEHFATRVAVMYLGKVVEEAEAEELFANPSHPYTRALLASILTPEPGLGLPELNLGSTFPNPMAPPSGCSFHPRCVCSFPRCSTEPPVLRDLKRARVACHLYDTADQPL
ncbi:MAG: ATP-binding cassette domain-containing protein [Rhizobiaceae bacterium]|nr:ATP-binding cassette domain-containing protein [Rhizobiaceae bacterium]